MIALLPEFPEWTAVITGRVTVEHQAFARDLERRIAEAGLSNRILFLGEVPDIKLWYRRVSLYVAPSRNEGFGLTPLEAMASGSAVVASDAGAYRYLIDEGGTGFVVPAGDGKALESAIRRYLADPDLLAAHSANALADVSARFPLEGEAEAIEQVYERLWARKADTADGSGRDRHRPFILDLADRQRGAHRVDVRRRGQLLDDEVLERGEVAGHAVQQEVEFARDHPGRPHDRPVAGPVGKGLQLGLRLVVEADQAEGDDAHAKRRAVQHAR